MTDKDQAALVAALAYALEAHAGQPRKGKANVPYVSHLLQVCGLALEYGNGDVELAQAALLHDVVEDTDASVGDVRERFGDHVARIVEDCTDLLEGDSPEEKSPWRERKDRYIEHLRGAPRTTRLVSACDKLHNLTNIVSDLRAEGVGFLDQFNATPPETLWYYRSLRDVFEAGDDLPPALRKTFDALVEDLAAYVEA